MKYRTLGTSNIKVSEISLGCWTLGGLYFLDGNSGGWADVNEEEAVAAIHLALDQGVNHFDNADVYGIGKAERVLAKALGSRSKEVVIASKVGHFKGCAEHAYEPLHLRHQCEQSLKNLKRDFIDLYYFHHADFGENDRYLDGAVETMIRLKDEGKIRLIGQSAYATRDFVRVVPKVKPDVLQARANILDDKFLLPGAPVRKLMEERKMSFVAFSPLGQGLLTGKYSAKNPPSFSPGDHRQGALKFSAEALAKLEPKIEALKNKFGKAPADLTRVAQHYLLSFSFVACVIPGFRDRSQVEMNLTGADKPLTAEEVKFIQKVFAG